jgi:hypothetical protein
MNAVNAPDYDSKTVMPERISEDFEISAKILPFILKTRDPIGIAEAFDLSTTILNDAHHFGGIFTAKAVHYLNPSPSEGKGSKLNERHKSAAAEYKTGTYIRDAEEFLEKCSPGHATFHRSETAALIAMIIDAYAVNQISAIQKLTAVLTGKVITAKKYERELPYLPDGLSYPSDRFTTSAEAGKHHGIVSYLRRVWGSIIQTGLIDRGHLATVDPEAAEALKKYFYNNGAARRTLPDDLFIPPQRNRPLRPPVQGQMPGVK